MAGKKVFLSYAAEDQFRLAPLLAAFTAWGISPNLLNPTRQPGRLLPETIQQIGDCEVYLRLCTGATRRSPQMAAADAAFHQLLEKTPSQGKSAKRKLVNLILDSAYMPDAQDKATLYIDTAGKTRALWLEELATPLGVATLKQRVSRRALLGMGVGAGLAVLSGGGAAVLLVQQQQAKDAAKSLPKINGVSGQARWKIGIGTFSPSTTVVTTLFDDNGAYYASLSDISGQAGMYALSLANKTASYVKLPLTSNDSIDSSMLSEAGGLVFIHYTDANGNPVSSAFHASNGALAFHFPAQSFSQPIFAGDSFYCLTTSDSGGTFVSAFDRQTGKLRWQNPYVINEFDKNSIGYMSPLAVANGLLYVSAFDHTLTCYDAGTGKQKWQFLALGQPTTPVIANGVVYAGARDGSVYALDATTGAKRWQSQTGAGITAPPTVSDGALYIGSIEGFFYAFDANNGALFWSSLLGDVETNASAYEVKTAPVLYRNVIAVASQGTLFAFDLRNGSPRWQYQPIPQSSVDISSAITYQGLFLIGSPDGNVYAVNP